MLALPVMAQRSVVRSGWNLFAPQQDVEMGRRLASEAESTFVLSDQHNPNAYIDALGQQLAAHAPRQQFAYQFKIVNDNRINSYALPGGFIYVTSGAIQAAQNEPQLAGLIAHQIAHVVLRHGTQQVSQAYADYVQNRNPRSVSVDAVISQLDLHFDRNPMFLRYTSEAERQADLIGTQIMYDTGFDPRVMAEYFDRIRNQRSDTTADFFSDHPSSANRLAIVRAELQRLGGLPRNLRGDSGDFHSVKERLLTATANSWPGNSDRGYSGTPDLPSTRMVTYRGREIGRASCRERV